MLRCSEAPSFKGSSFDRPARGDITETPKAKVESSGGESQVAAVLAVVHSQLQSRNLAAAARAVLGSCRAILGVGVAFVSIGARDDSELAITLLDADHQTLEADFRLPRSLDRLSERAARGHTSFRNQLAPKKKAGSTTLEVDRASNALLAPILLGDDVVAILGLLDKPNGFSTADSRMADVFAEMIAVAISNRRTFERLEQSRVTLESKVRAGAQQLRQSEEQFQTLVENLPDIIARFGSDFRHLYVSPSVQRLTGRPAREFLGKTNRELGMPTELVDRWDAVLGRVFSTGRAEHLEFSFETSQELSHFDCRVVPETTASGAVVSVLSVARDVTDRWLAHEAERKARNVAEALREATVALTRSRDRETVLETLLDRLRRMVPFDRAQVMLVEETSRVSVRAVYDGERVVPLAVEARAAFDPADHPIVREILSTGTAVTIPDIRADPAWSLPSDRSFEVSWMGVPLFARGDVTGLFSLSKGEVGYFREEHVKLAEAMASQASVAVENAVLFEQMQASTRRMQALSRRLVEVQESERRHIARELHDEAGQALASLRYGLRLLEREIEAGGGVAERLAELRQRTDAVIESLHRLAADLRPVSLDHLGLDAALRQYCRAAAGKFGLAVQFKARGLAKRRLPPKVETALFRVVQEAMANVVRHAHATQVDVLVERFHDRVRVMIEDDGVGFDASAPLPGNHFGLLGLRERAEAMGGTSTIESAPGAGTTIVVEVEIRAERPEEDPDADSSSDR